jgi:uncharacterized protein YndB with AHSA1/START domain
MLKTILIIAAVLVVGFVVVVLTRPDDFRLSRSTTIAAPPAVVFAQVNDFHKWEAWSPWAKLDPYATNSFEGPAEGVGAKFSWAGNSKVGTGSMTITESRPDDLVRLRLDFLKPFKQTSTTEFTMQPTENQTVVTWTMTGKNNFMAKAFSLFMDCEKMIGPDFEKGLANLKAVAEASPGT